VWNPESHHKKGGGVGWGGGGWGGLFGDGFHRYRLLG